MFGILLLTLGSFVPGDSLRMEMINGKPFVVYQVGEKETLYSLSKRYGTTVADILAQNPTADAGLEVGQILKIPYVARPKTNPAVHTADGIIHKVALKETLFSIARQYNVSVDDIKSWNNLKENSLSTGQEILIRKKSAAPPEVIPAATTTAAKTHTVVAKETLYSIARQYGMSVQQLKEWNNLQADEVKIGQVLAVAAPATSSAVVVNPVSTTTPAVKPAATSTVVIAPVKTETITISENVAGTDEIRESGLASLIEGTEGNRKYLAQHKTIKPGTILKIRNLANNQEVFVRVTGPPSTGDDGLMIRISKSAFDRLGATEQFRAEITYYK